MSRVTKIMDYSRPVFAVDYRGLKGSDLMAAATEMRKLLETHNVPALVLVTFDNSTYVTPAFMHHAEAESGAVMHLIERMAFVGLSPTKKIILKGYNLLFRRNFKAFDTPEEAIEYLLK
ncbi:MAG TPA: hypothetical protein VGK59_02340 [Ohtaekwangia sp.]